MSTSTGLYAHYHDLKVTVADKVATVALNRPEARNAINQRLIREQIGRAHV